MKKRYWDIHNHILPGLDDGAGNMEETYRLVKQEYAQGIRNIIFTPHYRTGMFEVSREEQIQVFKETGLELRKHFHDMSFFLGCEYYVHSADAARLTAAPYRIAATKSVLVEFSTRQSFQTIRTAVDTIMASGYTPIIAHAERYKCLTEDVARVLWLKQAGARLQLNADSVLGDTGLAAGRFCKKVLTEDLVDFIASDAHDVKFRGVHMQDCIQFIEKKYGEERADRIFIHNPKQLFPEDLFHKAKR